LWASAFAVFAAISGAFCMAVVASKAWITHTLAGVVVASSVSAAVNTVTREVASIRTKITCAIGTVFKQNSFAVKATDRVVKVKVEANSCDLR
jgi:hypothetical protein